MKALQIVVNGKQIVVAGLIEPGYVGAHVNILNSPDSPLLLDISGLQEGARLRWPGVPIMVGDEVSIRIVNTNTADVPSTIPIPRLSLLGRIRMCCSMFFALR
jgi:hypothetical protein